MNYSSVSIKDVIGRVIRNTRLQDSSYIEDMGEWIPEAMGYMRTKVNLALRSADIDIEFHKGRLPCGIRSLLAVSYGGARMAHYNGARTYGDVSQRKLDNSTFGTLLVNRATPGGGNIVESELYQLYQSAAAGHTYYSEMDWLNTSVQDGKVRAYYMAMPVDNEGYPLIPDNENYKEALYWYVRGKMIGAGFIDRVYSVTHCDDKFEKHAGRAIGQIRYPSVDQVAAKVENLNRFILPENYWESFYQPNSGGLEPLKTDTVNNTGIGGTLPANYNP